MAVITSTIRGSLGAYKDVTARTDAEVLADKAVVAAIAEIVTIVVLGTALTEYAFAR